MKKSFLFFDVSLDNNIKRFAFQRRENKKNFKIILQLFDIWEESPEFDDFVESINYFTTQEYFCFMTNQIICNIFDSTLLCNKYNCNFGILVKQLLKEHFFS